jgi:hypothetical protein
MGLWVGGEGISGRVGAGRLGLGWSTGSCEGIFLGAGWLCAGRGGFLGWGGSGR